MRRSAHARGLLRRFCGSLDRARCYPTRCVLHRPGTAHKSEGNSARLLFFERPTPRAWTYTNNAFEVSREMTLIAEAALRGHIGERQPVIAQLLLG
jgi:hypothetical protein